MKLSVIIPVHNEEQIIGTVIEEVYNVLGPRDDIEVIVVDDGSTDRTAQVINETGARIIEHPYRKGNGAAIKTGIRNASGDIFVFMDGDGQHNPQDIPRLLEPIGDYDLVIGARIKEPRSPRHRRLANAVYNVFARYLTSFRVEDLTSGFRAIKADLAKKCCHLLPNTFSYPSTMTLALISAGYSLKYVPIKVSQRQMGSSKINVLQDGFRFLVIMIRIAVLFNPLKVFMPLGFLVFSPGFLYAVYRLLTWQRIFTQPIVVSVSIGALILALGLISEQIALLRMAQFDR